MLFPMNTCKIQIPLLPNLKSYMFEVILESMKMAEGKYGRD